MQYLLDEELTFLTSLNRIWRLIRLDCGERQRTKLMGWHCHCMKCSVFRITLIAVYIIHLIILGQDHSTQCSTVHIYRCISFTTSHYLVAHTNSQCVMSILLNKHTMSTLIWSPQHTDEVLGVVMDRRKSAILLASTAARGDVSGASSTVDSTGTNTS